MNRIIPLLFLLFACFEIQAQCAVSVEGVNLNCNGDNTGQLEAVATGTPPFNFIWSNGATDSILNGLPAGVYSVTVTDALDCTATGEGQIQEPIALELNVNSTDEICNGDCTGTVTVDVSGGLPPYNYQWSDGQITGSGTITNLCAGTYFVTVTDGNGCAAEITTTIQAPSFEVTVQDVELSCNDESAVLTATVTGGAPGYTYFWSNGSTSQSIVINQPGTYTVFVTDSNGCQESRDVTVSIGSALSVHLEVENLDCQSGTAFQVTASNLLGDGTRQYDFAWSGPGVDGAMAMGNTDVRSNLGPGTYSVTITDEPNGCSGSDSIVVTQPQPLEVAGETNNPTCSQTCNGILQLQVTGGRAPYTFDWPTGDDGLNLNSNNDLCAGTQSVSITDSYGCTLVHEYTIDESPEMTLIITTQEESCGGECDGLIGVEIPGGTSPFTFEWSDGNTASVATNLCPGVYSVTVTDGNGCSKVGEAIISGADVLNVEVVTTGGECDENGGPFSVDVVVSGGTPPYLYVWSDGSDLPMIPEGIPFAEYSLTVTDDNGCSRSVNQIRNYGQIQDTGGVRFSRQTCEDSPIIYNAPVPDGWNQSVILPTGDTVSGPDLSLTEFGSYRYLATSPENTCLQTGSFTIFSTDLITTNNINLLTIDSLNCGSFNCLSVVGILGHSFNLDPFVINWYGPNGELLPNENSQEICGITLAGEYTAEVVSGCDTVVRSLSVADPVPCSAIIGNIYAEENVNCQLDQDDLAAPDVLIQFTDVVSGAIFYEISDALGGFLAVLPVGTYSITPLVNGNPPMDGCAPVMVTTNVVVPQNVELFLPAITNCPAMETWICLFGQRRCFENRMSVYYYNPTAEPVEDVVVTVELDPFYTDVLASIPIDQQVGQTLTFNIGTVQPFERAYFWITFTISCDAELGQTHCVRSIVTPNAICEDVPNWNGALVNIDKLECDGDSITFRVENIGDEMMSVPLSYVVVEDGIMMFGAPIQADALLPDGAFELRLPATGLTYQVRTNQEPNAPVDLDQPSFVLEGCGTGPADGSNFGLTNFFELGNGVPWEDYVCRQNTGSYDPNDKRGFPLGYLGGQIEPGTRIDYDIRFQNTGTDTAFTVVIRDTLETSLDLSTIKVEGGSHPFTVDIDTNRVLTFTFNNIMLPDSNVNALGSQGVVSFSIEHDTLLQSGDDIDNQAAIYFDFNEPIITNLSHHEIATEMLPNALRRLEAQQVAIGLFPNPVSGMLQVTIPITDVHQGDFLEVRDLYGRRVLSRKYQAVAQGWNVGHLARGYYIVVLTDANGRVKGRTGFVKGE